MRKTVLLIAASVAALATVAVAQQQPAPRPAAAAAEDGPSLASPRHAAAQQAGARALHLCSGIFSSEMPRDLIDRTSPAVSRGLKTEIDEAAKTVSVTYRDDMPPRVAVHRPLLGCTQLPIGATKALGAALPRAPANITVPKLDDRPWPMGEKDATAPLPAPKQAAVEKLIDEAFKNQQGTYRGTTWGVVVVKDGKIVAERYQNGFGPHIGARTNSMCKSVASSLVGVGVRKGLLDIHKKAPLREWRQPGDPRGEITLDHLLHMGSGLYTESGGNPQADLYQSGAAAAEVSALNMVDATPGSRFVYAGSDTILLVRALRQAVNNDRAFLTYPHREFLWKLGMTRTVMETDWNNDFLASGQCWSTARDFGRFGLLYLADGMWNGERILPAGWSNMSRRPLRLSPPARPAAARATAASSGSMAAWMGWRRTPTRPTGRRASSP